MHLAPLSVFLLDKLPSVDYKYSLLLQVTGRAAEQIQEQHAPATYLFPSCFFILDENINGSKIRIIQR